MTTVADEDDGFRAGLARGELLLATCSGCGEILDYSARACPRCGSVELGWSSASGRARLRCAVEMSVSYSVEQPSPYVIVSVELAEGPHILARFDGELESAYAGREVVADVAGGVLRFRPAG